MTKPANARALTRTTQRASILGGWIAAYQPFAY